MSKEKPISVTILSEEYMVACDPGEEENLVAAARHLNEKMKEIRASGRVLSSERIAVMAALNLTHEMLQLGEKAEQQQTKLASKLRSMREKVEASLNDSNQLEL